MKFCKYVISDDNVLSTKVHTKKKTPLIMNLENNMLYTSYHYGSTYRQWLHLIEQISKKKQCSEISLENGINSVLMALNAICEAKQHKA
jgi:hypothetical protein